MIRIKLMSTLLIIATTQLFIQCINSFNMSRNSGGRKLSWKTSLVYYYGKVIGICPLLLHNEGNFKFSSSAIIYAFILSIIYFVTYLFALDYRLKNPFPTEPTVSLLVDGFVMTLQFLTTISCWLTFACRQKKIQRIIEAFKNTKQMAQKLGLAEDHEEILRLIRYRLLIVNTYFSGLFFFDQFFYSKRPNYKIMIWAPFSAIQIVIYNVLFLFVTALSVIVTRFHRLNIGLKNVALNDKIGVRNKFREWRSSTLDNIEYFGKLHEELKILAESIADFFAFPLLIIITASFVQNVHIVNALLLMVKRRLDFNLIGMGVIWISLLKMLGIILDFFFLSIVSETICEKANNTGNILHKMWIDYKPINCERVVKQISLQLLQRRLTISLYGFLKLDFQFIYNICGTVTTYIIIMLQLDDYKSKGNHHQ